MNIEKSLELNARRTAGEVEKYLDNPESFTDIDVKEFGDAVRNKSVAFWARGQQIENSYSVAKKIIDSIQ